MGRGLSPLQTTILGLAYRQWRLSRKSRLRTRDVYQALYGWEHTSVRYIPPQGEPYWRLVWDVETIGATAYNRGAVRVSRAIRRLVTRGLLTPLATGKRTRAEAWRLTAAGRVIAEQLLVKKRGRGMSQSSPTSLTSRKAAPPPHQGEGVPHD
jgi:hypothetical protein